MFPENLKYTGSLTVNEMVLVELLRILEPCVGFTYSNLCYFLLRAVCQSQLRELEHRLMAVPETARN